MVQVYTTHDINLRNECLLEFRQLQAAGQDAKAFKVQFQFPPRILSDNRKGKWREGELPGTEPVAVFETSGPREITLSWTYIVDGAQFTTANIAQQVKLVRGYFASVRARSGSINLIVKFRYALFGDPEKTENFRVKSIDVKHSDTIICPIRNVRETFIEDSYPLRTDITIDLRLWTKGGAEEKIQALNVLNNRENPKWY